MEKLRPFWERKTDNSSEDYDDMAEFSEFQISLFNTDGVLKSNLAFETDISRLDDILIQRISKGVRQFFNAMKKTFDNSYINKTATVNHVNIFLAGNSSKSPILKKIFQENINEWNSIIMCKDKTDSMQSYFSLFPPLGTSEAYDIQKERGYINDDNLNTPNGKTGVAWGLIEGRKGGRIQIVEEISPESEAKFAYYLGISKKKTFCMKISRDTEYMSWIRFIPAIQKKFEILYTSLPEATNGELKESDDGVLRKRLELEDYGEGKYIFIRLVGRDKIEFVVSTDVDSICKNNIVEITL